MAWVQRHITAGTATAVAPGGADAVPAIRCQRSYTLDLTETKGDMDEAWDLHGVEVICDSKSLLYLEGTTIDFKDEIMGRGFVFSNPNATSSCGCGSSFSA